MSAVSSLEEKDEQEKPTFDINFAVNILALSLPFSTILIIGVLSFSEFFIDPIKILGTGVSIIAISFLPVVVSKLRRGSISKGIKDWQTFEGFNTHSQTSEDK